MMSGELSDFLTSSTLVCIRKMSYALKFSWPPYFLCFSMTPLPSLGCGRHIRKPPMSISPHQLSVLPSLQLVLCKPRRSVATLATPQRREGGKGEADVSPNGRRVSREPPTDFSCFGRLIGAAFKGAGEEEEVITLKVRIPEGLPEPNDFRIAMWTCYKMFPRS